MDVGSPVGEEANECKSSVAHYCFTVCPDVLYEFFHGQPLQRGPFVAVSCFCCFGHKRAARCVAGVLPRVAISATIECS